MDDQVQRSERRVLVAEGSHRVGLPIGRGDVPKAILRRSTVHFNVYADPALGRTGTIVANVVSATCENAYATIGGYFGGIALSTLPVNVIISDLGGLGAYHHGCSGVDIYCHVKRKPRVVPRFTAFGVAAELVEIFEAAQSAGWNCSASNGESLSRVLSTALYPAQLNGFATAHQWLDGYRPDFVNQTAPSDSNPIANGCGVLFLNYLRYQLGYGWSQIVHSASATLGQTYTLLTGDPSDPFPAFKALLNTRFPAGSPSRLTTDNPFPIARLRHQPPHPPHPMMPHPPHPMMPHLRIPWCRALRIP